MNSIKKTRIDWKDRSIIMLLYKEQETLIEVGEHSTTAKIKKKGKTRLFLISLLIQFIRRRNRKQA